VTDTFRAHAAQLLLPALLPLSGVLAQESPSMPDAPAFTYLNASPTTISRPTSARDFAVSLVDGIDSLGRVQRGLAFDFTPWVLSPRRMTHQLYRTRRAYYVLGNLQASIGTVQAVDDSTATDLAFGLRTNLWDGTDPLADDSLGRQMDRVVATCIARSTNPQTGAPDERKIEECADSAITRLNDEWLDAGHWNDFGLSIAAAFGARLVGSEIDRFVGRGGAMWATVAVPIGESFGQIVGQARGDWLRASDDGEDTTAFTGGAKLVFGNERLGGFAEAVGSLANRGVDRTTGRWSVGVEYRATETLWLSTGFGSTLGNAVTGNRAMVIANLRWNVSGERSFAPRNP
jgi:hypothetical protein